MDWRSFWNEDHALYVNARHKAVHAGLVADGILALLPPGRPRTLDWGCGEAEAAKRIAARCAMLYLYDSAPRVRAAAQQRTVGHANIRVLDEAMLAALPDASLDAVTIVSVAQYLSRDTLVETLLALKSKISEGGCLIIGDVIPPELSPIVDVRALLVLALRNGFFFAAILGLARTFFSPYRTLRGKLGLTRWNAPVMLGLLHGAGFDAARAPRNIGHNQARMTFVAHLRKPQTSLAPEAVGR